MCEPTSTFLRAPEGSFASTKDPTSRKYFLAGPRRAFQHLCHIRSVRVAVIGAAGLVARATLLDLLSSHNDVIALDLKRPSLDVEYLKCDLNDPPQVASAVRGCDWVINCAQYYLNIKAMEACLIAGTNYTDLGGLFWMTNNQLSLNQKFERERLLAILGMGAEPGISNIAAARLFQSRGLPESIRIRNGWKNLSSEGRINWSLDTQMDEMTMPAPIWENGAYTSVNPLSLSEEVNFREPVGSVRTYITIHSELATFPTSFEGVQKVDWMEGGSGFEDATLLAKLGFGDEKEIFGVSPRKYLAELLRSKGLIGYEKSEPKEWESVKVAFEFGRDERKSAELEIVTPPVPVWGVDATEFGAGVPSSIAVQLNPKGDGVLPPEKVIDPVRFLSELEKRGFRIFT